MVRDTSKPPVREDSVLYLNIFLLNSLHDAHGQPFDGPQLLSQVPQGHEEPPPRAPPPKPNEDIDVRFFPQ